MSSLKITKNTKIAVIAGGLSSEREVSLRSGQNVFEALKRLGYKNTILFDFYCDDDLSTDDSIQQLTSLFRDKKIDLAFPVTHGTFGEDGCMQGFLDLLGLPYVGSKVEASAICMNKITSKKILGSSYLPVLPFWYASKPRIYENPFEEGADSEEEESLKRLLSGPFIVKPVNEGSSVGMYKVDNFDDIEDDEAFRATYPNSMVEPFVEGVELTASVIQLNYENKAVKDIISKLGDENELAYHVEDNYLSLPLLELRTDNEFYDYEAKYTEGKTEFVLPAEIPGDIAQAVHEAAIDAFKATGCKGFARVDFIVADEESDFAGPNILEINTLPGMTDLSDMPAQAEAAGLTYDDLVELILRSA